MKYRDGKALKRHKIHLHSEPRETTTDENGEAVFEDVEAGDHTLSYDVEGETISQGVAVAANEVVDETGTEVEIPEQAIEVQVAAVASSSKTTNLVYTAVALGCLLLAGFIAAVVVRKKRSNTFTGGMSGPSPSL